MPLSHEPVDESRSSKDYSVNRDNLFSFQPDVTSLEMMAFTRFMLKFSVTYGYLLH